MRKSSVKYLLRVLMLAAGLFFLALGIALSTKSGLGVSPISSLAYVLSQVFPVSMGTFTTAMNLLFVLLQVILLGRRFQLRRLLQLVVVFVFGFFTDFTLSLVAPLSISAYPARLALGIGSCLVMGFGVYLEIRARVVVMSNEGALSVIAEKTGKPFGTIKIINDLTLIVLTVIVSLLCLRRVAGVREGTLIAAFLVGICAQFFDRHIRVFDPLFEEPLPVETADGVSVPLVITIERQWGSGGHEVGELLARELGLPFYDFESVSAWASGGAPAPERGNGQLKGFLFTLYNQANSYTRDQTAEDEIFEQHGRAVREMAEKESCVIVSRLASYYLRRRPNTFHVFLSASDDFRLDNLTELDPGQDRARLLELIHREDELRYDYCLHYTGTAWGLASHYQLCLDTSLYGIEKTSAMIRAALNERNS